ncbi:MAG: extracellular solute-binding protein [Candidatus Rokubacteria bacterium]|nr:extracellular solute-binding protein [Candidatus Rokubacteria bacterium]
MSTMTRRTFLATSGLAAGSAVLSEGRLRPARADKPLSLAGWVFKPDTVKDYVDFYNKKFNAQVKYEAIPWAQYHPTMETRAFGGEIVDVMYCNHNNRERWYENGLLRALDDLPGADELKKKMTPANLESLKSKDGAKLLGLPYFTSLFILIYNEPMLQQAGIKEPAKSWDELVEQCSKLKRDKVSDTPFLPNWNNSPSGTMPQFMTDCFSEGAQVFDAKNRVIVDQEPGAARAMERWQKIYKAGLVNPEIFTKTSSTDTHRLFWTGRYAYHTNHSYYLKTIAGEPENSKLAPKKAKMVMYPGTGNTYMWTDSYVLNAKSKALEDGWKLARFLGGNLNGDWYVQRQWCLISGLDNPYPEMYQAKEIVESYDRWIDLKLLRRQYEKGKVIAAYKEPWYGEYDTKAVPIVHDLIRGALTVPQGLKDLVKLQKSLV